MLNVIDKFEGEYRFLSNFWISPVEFNGRIFHSVEQAYQFEKCDDPVYQKAILEATTPRMAKKVGKKKNMEELGVEIREDWEEVKLDVMKKLVTIKFKNPELKQKLIDTGDAELIEGNWWHDVFWGVCNGIGENHLGKILMEVRQILSQE
jgi:ribA/ribD-fused uncharacterized protein